MPGFSKPALPHNRHQTLSKLEKATLANQEKPTSFRLSCVLGSCLAPLRGSCRDWTRSKNTTTRSRARVQRFAPSGTSLEGCIRVDAAAFLFCNSSGRCQAVVRRDGTSQSQAVEDRTRRRHDNMTPLYRSLPAINVQACVAALLQGILSSFQQGLESPSGVAMSCLPLVVPFQVPPMPEDAWMGNKRARAFHRICIVGGCLQGTFAVVKLARGNLIGGMYDGIQSAMGAYAVCGGREGLSFFPTYLTISGFNGLISVFQVFQSYNGLPLQLIPKLAIFPPAVSLLCTYWGWQFCREVRAIAVGLPGYGPQDTCFVRFMNAAWWPISRPVGSGDEFDADDEAGRVDGFTRYSGNGHVLGECDN